MSEEIETIRAFVALSLSDEVKAALKVRSIAYQDQFSHMNIKWVPYSNYHLTLIFIGNIPFSEVDEMEVLITKAVEGLEPFELEIGETALFPPDQENKGVLMASVQPNDALLTLQSQLDRVFRMAGYDLIDRPYRPHVTLARLKKNKISPEEFDVNQQPIKTPINQVHIYETHKKDGKVVNSIIRSVQI